MAEREHKKFTGKALTYLSYFINKNGEKITYFEMTVDLEKPNAQGSSTARRKVTLNSPESEIPAIHPGQQICVTGVESIKRRETADNRNKTETRITADYIQSPKDVSSLDTIRKLLEIIAGSN